MVRSNLVPSIHYIELKSLDPSDTQEHNYKAPLYEASVLGINTIISIGNIKNTYATYRWIKDAITHSCASINATCR